MASSSKLPLHIRRKVGKASMDQLQVFVRSLERVYGPLSIANPENWNPPHLSVGHRGRNLWIDAIGVLNLLTLQHEIGVAKAPLGLPDSANVLTLADRLVSAVHSTLGYTRDGASRLLGATDVEPLRGGLRSGNLDGDGPYQDGQYHHHLTLWMFALNRFTLATNDPTYNDQAIALAEATHPFFFDYKKPDCPQMVWKVSIDMTEPLVSTEGDLDPMNGYVVYNILQATYGCFQGGTETPLENEIEDYKVLIPNPCSFYKPTGDPLEVGMTLWAAQWFFDQKKVREVMETHVHRLTDMHFRETYFLQDLERRVAFREFGTCLGIGCVVGSLSSLGQEVDTSLETCRKQIIATWYRNLAASLVPIDEQPITNLLFAAALVPGAFRAGYFGPETISDDDKTTLLHGGT